MHLIRGLHNLQRFVGGSVVTIGNFDGLHLGHQNIFKYLEQKAKNLALPLVVIIFEPQPREFFLKDGAPARLTRLREKLLYLEKFNIDVVLCLQFNQKMAQLRAKDFVQQILIDKLNLKYLLVGEDFHFAYKREGNFDYLKQISVQYDYQVESLLNIEHNEKRISSTLIRAALADGDLIQAKSLLGRNYSMCGRISHGNKLGRTIGVPTANVYIHRIKSPIFGVYVVKVAGIGTEDICGVANVGHRPTVDGTRTLLEVHLLDFDRDIYGRHIEVKFLHKIRCEQRFESFDLLKQQILNDIEQTKLYFKGTKHG